MHAVEDEAGEKIGHVLFDERGEVDVVPALVALVAARQVDQARDRARHLHDGVHRIAALFGSRPNEQVVALVQELREWMARIDRERREHRKNFLLKIAARPGGALRVQLIHVMDEDIVLAQERLDLLVPERVLLRHHLMHDALDRFKGRGRAHPIGSDVARLARDLLLDAGDANLEKLIEVRADDPEELDPFEQRLGRVLRFLQDAAVELEPAQLAVDEIFRIGKIAFGRHFVRRRHRHDIGRRRRSRGGKRNVGRHKAPTPGSSGGYARKPCLPLRANNSAATLVKRRACRPQSIRKLDLRLTRCRDARGGVGVSESRTGQRPPLKERALDLQVGGHHHEVGIHSSRERAFALPPHRPRRCLRRHSDCFVRWRPDSLHHLPDEIDHAGCTAGQRGTVSQPAGAIAHDAIDIAEERKGSR